MDDLRKETHYHHVARLTKKVLGATLHPCHDYSDF